MLRTHRCPIGLVFIMFSSSFCLLYVGMASGCFGPSGGPCRGRIFFLWLSDIGHGDIVGVSGGCREPSVGRGRMVV